MMSLSLSQFPRVIEHGFQCSGVLRSTGKNSRVLLDWSLLSRRLLFLRIGSQRRRVDPKCLPKCFTLESGWLVLRQNLSQELCADCSPARSKNNARFRPLADLRGNPHNVVPTSSYSAIRNRGREDSHGNASDSCAEPPGRRVSTDLGNETMDPQNANCEAKRAAVRPICWVAGGP